MSEDHRRMLNRHRRSLVRNISNVEPILDFLVTSGVFTTNDDNIQAIRAQETPSERARRLLDVLHTRDQGDYGHFVHALHSVHPNLAQLLEDSAGAKFPTSSGQLEPFTTNRINLPDYDTTARARKLQQVLRDHYRDLARSTTVLDHQTFEEPIGLDNVFVTLSVLKFDEIRSLFAHRKKLTAEKIQELASKTWNDRRSGEEITDLRRLLQFDNGKEAGRCLLLGHAASGKTLTLTKLASLWVEGREEFLKGFEFVFYVSGRDKRALEAKTGVDVLRLDQFAGILRTKKQEDEMAEYLEEKSETILILFDGVDEGGEKWAECDGIQQILCRKALTKCSFVATGRPCLKAYELIPRCVQYFHLAGLTEYHLDELLRRRLGDDKGRTLSEELKKVEWTKLRALMRETPLLANMVAALVKDGLSLPKTRTEVYTTMLLNLVSRSQSKTSSASPISSNLEDLSEEVKESLSRIGEIALKGLRQGKFVFDARKDVEAECGDAAQRLGLMEEFRTTSVLGDRHEIHFCHVTWQEYLGAYCISHAEDVQKELLACQEGIGIGEETLPFWRFVSGLLDIRKLKILMTVLGRQVRIVHNRWLLLFKMSCLAEALQQPSCSAEEEEMKKKELLEASAISLPKNVDFSGCVLSRSEVDSISMALSYAPHVSDAKLTSCNLELVHLQMLSVTGGLQHLEGLELTGNNLHGDSLAELRKGLHRSHELQTLRLIRCSLVESDCDVLCQILKTNKSLQTLSLYRNPLGSKGLEILWPALRVSQVRVLDLGNTVQTPASSSDKQSPNRITFAPSLSELYLSENNLSTADAKSVVDAAKNSSTLSVLKLSRNRIDNGIVPVLRSLFQERVADSPNKQSTAVALNVLLHDNDVDKEALEELARQMPDSSKDSVECGMFVFKGGGKISQRDLSPYFDEYMRKGSTGELELVYEGLDDSGAQQVAEKLCNDLVHVEALLLSWNSVGDEGATCLASALRRNSSLRALSLYGNKVGDAGFAALCESLVKSNSTLQLLTVGRNPIFASNGERHHADAAKLLGNLLKHCRGLKYVGLSKTGLGDAECVVMAEALKDNTSDVQFLQLTENKITDAGVAALCRGLMTNTSVRFLDLSKNPFSRDGVSEVLCCLEARNKTGHPLARVFIGDVSSDIDTSSFTEVVSRSNFTFWSVISVVDTICVN